MSEPSITEAIDRLRVIKSELLIALKAIDVSIAQAGGYDLVSWAGDARHEQRCSRCGYWIFAQDKVCAIMTDETQSVYIHRRCAVLPADTEVRT